MFSGQGVGSGSQPFVVCFLGDAEELADEQLLPGSPQWEVALGKLCGLFSWAEA